MHNERIASLKGIIYMRKILFLINILETQCHGYEHSKYTGMLFLAPTILIHIAYSPLAMRRSWQIDISFGLYNQRIVFQFLAGGGGLSSPYGQYRLWVSCVWNTVRTASVFPGAKRQEREPDHSSSSNSEVKNEQSCNLAVCHPPCIYSINKSYYVLYIQSVTMQLYCQ